MAKRESSQEQPRQASVLAQTAWERSGSDLDEFIRRHPWWFVAVEGTVSLVATGWVTYLVTGSSALVMVLLPAAVLLVTLGLTYCLLRVLYWARAPRKQRDDARNALEALVGPSASRELAGSIAECRELYSAWLRKRAFLGRKGDEPVDDLEDLPVGDAKFADETMANYFDDWKTRIRILVDAALALGVELEHTRNRLITRPQNVVPDLVEIHKILQDVEKGLKWLGSARAPQRVAAVPQRNQVA